MRKFDEKNQKTLTNKGFSLVELIIVVAIMAVLIGVLAPQYLRYVEKSRLQKDNTSISEFANVLKMSAAEEYVASSLTTQTIKFSTAAGSEGELDQSTIADANLLTELKATLDLNEIKLTSNTYKGNYPVITVEIDATTKIIKVSATGWKDSQNATATTASNPKVF